MFHGEHMPNDVVDENAAEILEETPEQKAAREEAEREDADFEAGYLNTPTETPPADEDKSTETKPEGETPASTEESAPVVVDEPKYRQVTEAEWNELQKKAAEIDTIRTEYQSKIDKAFGKVGGLERTLAAIQSATPSGVAVEVTDEIVADLKREFPELASHTLKAFQSFASKLKGTAPAQASIDPEAMQQAVTASVTALQSEALEEDHPNWREIVGAPDSNTPYRQWLAKQPAEYQQRLGSTNSAAVISRSLDKFKAATDQETEAKAKADAEIKAKADAEAKKKADAEARRKQLEAAATPRGSGGHQSASSDDDEFESGFKSG